MENTSDIFQNIHCWKNERVPLSKKDIVCEMSDRLGPIVDALLERIAALESRLAELETLSVKNSDK
jgi:hypothetical protein